MVAVVSAVASVAGRQIFLAKSSVPALHYRFFVELLLETIREEIAACMEKAYERMSSDEVVRMLGLPNKADVQTYLKKVGRCRADDAIYTNWSVGAYGPGTRQTVVSIHAGTRALLGR